MNNYCVYMHISPSSKRYIGITNQQNPNRRWRNGKGYSVNDYFTKAINKYGWDNFQHIIIAKGLTEEEAKWLEIELIKVWDTTNRNKGYNITKGGEGTSGWIPSEETRKRMSESHMGKYCGENHHMYGKYGKDNFHYGCKRSEETRKKMSENHTNVNGENNPFYGKSHTEETRKKMSENRKGKYCGKNNPKAKAVICITTNKIFDTVTEGAKFYNIKGTSSISNCCKGKAKSCGKYQGKKLVWRYLNHNHNTTLRGKDISKLHKNNTKVA